jgi:hypothetical protein
VRKLERRQRAIRFLQQKTKVRVAIFATPQLIARLADAERRELQLNTVPLPPAIVVREDTGRAWTEWNFRVA